MPAFSQKLIAPVGSTGNNTHTGVSVSLESITATAIQFVVEAVGGTPTVTWKAQGSMDGTNWFDLQYITSSSDTSANAALTATGVGAQIIFLSSPPARSYYLYRVVTSANTNVTYRVELYAADQSR